VLDLIAKKLYILLIDNDECKETYTMTSINQSNRFAVIRSSADMRFIASRKGWNDARTGMPFDYNFVDSCSMAVSAAYENSRLRVLAMTKLGMKVPAWNSDSVVPPKVRAAILNISEISQNERLGGTGGFWPIGVRGWREAVAA